MRNLEKAYYENLCLDSVSKKCRDKLSQNPPLHRLLGYIRTVSHENGSELQAEYVRPLLNAIIEKPCEWNRFQCAQCFKSLLKNYITEGLDLLMSVSGYAKGYTEIVCSDRRKKYAASHLKNNGSEIGEKTWVKREGTILNEMASGMQRDYSDDPSKLMSAIMKALTPQELQNLGLWELSASVAGTDTKLVDASYNLYRYGRISSIDKIDSMFIGRTAALNALQEGFQRGYHTQIIGSSRVWGKSRLALEYARLHADDYRIICWINAWQEECISSSILKFFDIAKVDVDPLSSEHLKEVFLEFFRVNDNWLIIFDHADYSAHSQKEMLESYIPESSSGHVIITCSMSKVSGTNKFHFLDDLIDSNEGVNFVKKALGFNSLDKAAKDIVTICGGDICCLGWITSFIQQSKWVDCNTYLHLLSDYGCGLDMPYYGPFIIAAFEFLMRPISFNRKCSPDPIFKAIEQFLIVCTLFRFCDIDLRFLSHSFRILPDPLDKICKDEIKCKQLKEIAKKLGFYEIREDVLQYNEIIHSHIEGYFDETAKAEVCMDVLSRMNEAIYTLRNDRYIENSQAVLTHAISYLNSICIRLSRMESNIGSDEIEQKYLEVWNACSRFRQWV